MAGCFPLPLKNFIIQDHEPPLLPENVIFPAHGILQNKKTIGFCIYAANSNNYTITELASISSLSLLPFLPMLAHTNFLMDNSHLNLI